MTRLWIHGASVGDMRAIHPFVSAWEEQFPAGHITVTAWTQGGRILGSQLFSGHHFIRPPLPLPMFATRFLKKNRPDLAVFEYLELYPPWVMACHSLGIPTLVIDGRVTSRSLRIRRLLRASARCLSGFCAQTDADAQAAQEIGVHPDRVWLCGNGKYDGLDVAAPRPSDVLEAKLGRPDVVIGSLHPDEEEAALHALSQTGLSAVIAPRYIERTRRLERRCRRLGLPVSLRSQNGPPERIRILDTYGELGAAYGLAQVSIIGGTFGRRNGQNMVEAAVHNNRIIHGPNVQNVELERSVFATAGAVQVNNWSEAFSEVPRGHGPIDTRGALSKLFGATQNNIRVAHSLLLSHGRTHQKVDHSAFDE